VSPTIVPQSALLDKPPGRITTLGLVVQAGVTSHGIVDRRLVILTITPLGVIVIVTDASIAVEAISAVVAIVAGVIIFLVISRGVDRRRESALGNL